MGAHVESVYPAVARAPIAPLVPLSFAGGEIERNRAGIPRPLCDHSADAEGRGARDRIEQARCAFVSRTHARIERAAELTTTLESNDPSTAQAALGELHTIAHGLCGTAGSFGYDRLSELAGMLEELIFSSQNQYQRIVSLVIEIAAEFLNYRVDRRPNLAR